MDLLIELGLAIGLASLLLALTPLYYMFISLGLLLGVLLLFAGVLGTFSACVCVLDRDLGYVPLPFVVGGCSTESCVSRVHSSSLSPFFPPLPPSLPPSLFSSIPRPL